MFKKNPILELQDRIDDMSDTISSLRAENEDYRRTIATFTDTKYAYEAAKAELSRTHSQEISTLRKALEVEKNSVARKVNNKLRAIGVNNFVSEEVSSDPAMDDKTILHRFSSMPESPEKHEYFKTYEKIISRATKQ